jgi:hypothetical protein
LVLVVLRMSLAAEIANAEDDAPLSGALDVARAACNFRERDVIRAVKAITAAGQRVHGVRFDKAGGFVVLVGDRPDAAKTANAWDEVLDNGTE